MTKETGLLRDLNLKPGDRVVDKEGMDVNIINRHGVLTALWINGTSIPVTQSIGIYTVTHRAPRTIGTLKEIGAKVGDVVEWRGGAVYTIGLISGCKYYEVDDTDNELSYSAGWTIISRATQSPVRTVTKKEIVPGVYGVLRVSGAETDRVYLKVEGCGLSPSELDTLIQNLQDIREAM